MVEDMNL